MIMASSGRYLQLCY